MQKASSMMPNPVAPMAGAPMPNRAMGMPATPPQESGDFRGYFKVETYPHNSVIFRPGDPADKVYLLKSGRVRLIRLGKGASRSVVSILRAGDLFGDMMRPEGAQTEELAVAAGEAAADLGSIMLVGMLVFTFLILVGYAYDIGKGVLKFE